ncbi:MAG TPA: response regulator [Candidatus Saccharimonadales bacterium]|nr:response regulator [Candidatus Saccharimonadales bacterium]
MAKILLVEDDKSLREIYGVRLQAEGYEIITAGDGEQALAVAIKERPTLIITDVMMPKISGFDMLDILRSTTETRDIKVIMMTALSSDDQRARGEQIGADRYLVKSQVGIEDVVRTVHEVLGDRPAAPPAPAAPAPITPPTPTAPQPVPPPTPASMPPVQQPVPQAPVAPPPATLPAQPQQPQPPSVPSQSITPAQMPQPLRPPVSSAPLTAASRQKIIQPINDPHARIDISELLDKELAKEAGLDVANRPPIATTAQEQALVNDQIQQATAPQPVPVAQTPPAVPVVPGAGQQPASRPAPVAPQRVFDISPPRAPQ